jgi:hypothetical protein
MTSERTEIYLVFRATEASASIHWVMVASENPTVKEPRHGKDPLCGKPATMTHSGTAIDGARAGLEHTFHSACANACRNKVEVPSNCVDRDCAHPCTRRDVT